MGVHSKVKAVFLDRDGVLNKAVIVNGLPYPPGSLNELEILPGVKQGLEQLKELRYLLIVLTNQPDVARKITPIKTVEIMNNYLKEKLNLDDIYCCIHDSTDNCTCRKPKPGMVFSAAEKWDIDLVNSFIIGDRWKDIETGINSGLRTILIDYNYNEKHISADYICSNFSEAAQIVKSLTYK